MPVLQCLQYKVLEAKAGVPGAAERYRVVLSDIDNFVQCMLATQANHVVHDGLLEKGCIVRMKQYQAQSLRGKRCVVFSCPIWDRCILLTGPQAS